jgi:hypothetical protein
MGLLGFPLYSSLALFIVPIVIVLVQVWYVWKKSGEDEEFFREEGVI